MPYCLAILLSHFLNWSSDISPSIINFLKIETDTIYADIFWIVLLFIIRPPTVTKKWTIFPVLAFIGIEFLSAACTRYWNHRICFDITFGKIPCQEGNVGFGKIAEKFVEFTTRKRKTLGGFSWAHRAGGGKNGADRMANRLQIATLFIDISLFL